MDSPQHPGQKIKWIIDHFEKGNAAEFARKTSLSAPTVKSYVDEKIKPGYDALQSILKAYPEINISWFILNIGPIKSKLGPTEQNIIEQNKRLREGIKNLYRIHVEGVE